MSSSVQQKDNRAYAESGGLVLSEKAARNVIAQPGSTAMTLGSGAVYTNNFGDNVKDAYLQSLQLAFGLADKAITAGNAQSAEAVTQLGDKLESTQLGTSISQREIVIYVGVGILAIMLMRKFGVL